MSRVSVNVNGLSLVHENSGGVSTATLPDVCFTAEGAAVPFANVARSRDLAFGSNTVRVDGGNRAAVAGSSFGRSVGDDPGVRGGVTSGVVGREASFISHSFDVAIEGRGACRLTDKLLHNRGNTIDCAGALQEAIADSRAVDRDLTSSSDKAATASSADPTPPPAKVTRRFGFDSNLSTLPPETDVWVPSPSGNLVKSSAPRVMLPYASTQSCSFVGRYLTSNKYKPQLTRDEATALRRSGFDVFAIWEYQGKNAQNRSFKSHSVKAQIRAGKHDAQKADAQARACGWNDAPIYFTVDFPATPSWWTAVVTDTESGERLQRGEFVLAYFHGINSIIHKRRTGVYGSYLAVSSLFDADRIHYGWQQIWGARGQQVDKRAQLLQYAIYPGQKRGTKGLRGVSWPPAWFSDGAGDSGGLDLDYAVAGDFGQWPHLPPAG